MLQFLSRDCFGIFCRMCKVCVLYRGLIFYIACFFRLLRILNTTCYSFYHSIIIYSHFSYFRTVWIAFFCETSHFRVDFHFEVSRINNCILMQIQKTVMWQTQNSDNILGSAFCIFYSALSVYRKIFTAVLCCLIYELFFLSYVG